MVKQIILDTNFMMVPGQFKVDIFAEIQRICDFSYELVVIKETVEELENIIVKQKGQNKAAAMLALQRGATIIRTHDVAALSDALAVWNAVEEL